MSNSKTHLLLLKGAMFDLSPEEQATVRTWADELKAQVAERGELGFVAISLASLELAIEVEEKDK